MKTTGLIIIFLCFLSVGISKAIREKKNAKQLEDLLGFIKYIRNQIYYFNMAIPDIYNSYKTENKHMKVFLDTIVTESWSKAIESTNSIYPKINYILSEFGNGLGKTSKEEQIAHCDYYINCFEDEQKNINQNSANKAKTSIALWAYIGLMILILFL